MSDPVSKFRFRRGTEEVIEEVTASAARKWLLEGWFVEVAFGGWFQVHDRS